MKKHIIDSVKLGIFVLTGIVLLIFSLYVLGKNRSMFGNRFEVKAHFKDVNGLVSGNNVRFSGIDIGSVGEVAILNDTVIEVTMNIDKKMKNFIRQNAVVSLGTDGLIGNRVVNISPAGGDAPFINGGELLHSKEEVSTQAMLRTLSHSNENIAVITEELRSTIHRINSSAQLNALLDDQSVSMSANLKASLAHLHEATEKASSLMTDATATLALASQGKGTLATLLTDTTLSQELHQAVRKIKEVEASAERLANDLNQVVASVDKDFNSGQGVVNALMKDSLMAAQLRRTIENVEKGTGSFNENMEALKHNFLFKGYFKKLEKEKKKAEKQKLKQ